MANLTMKCCRCILSISSSSQGNKYPEPSTLWNRLPPIQTYFSGSGDVVTRKLEKLFRLLDPGLLIDGANRLLPFCRGWIDDTGRLSSDSLPAEENFEIPDKDWEDEVWDVTERGNFSGGLDRSMTGILGKDECLGVSVEWLFPIYDDKSDMHVARRGKVIMGVVE